MVAIITGRVPRYTQRLHGACTARVPWQECPPCLCSALRRCCSPVGPPVHWCGGGAGRIPGEGGGSPKGQV